MKKNFKKKPWPVQGNMEIFTIDLSFSVQFSCWLWPILLEMLTVHIGARLGLETLLYFEAPGDLQVDIVKMQRLKLG